MKISKRDLQLILVLIGVVIFALLYFAVHQPLEDDTLLVEAEIAALKPELDLLEDHNLKMPEYQAKIDEVTAISLDFTSAYPGDIKEEDLLVWVMGMEDNIDFSFIELSFKDSERISQFPGVALIEGVNTDVEINAYGTGATINTTLNYDQLKDSIDHIYDSNQLTSLDTVAVAYDSTLATLNTVITFSQYYLDYPGAQYVQSPMPSVSMGVDQPFGNLTGGGVSSNALLDAQEVDEE